MARRGDDLDWDDEGLDPDGPSRADLERFGDEFRTCPECGSAVYDQAELCHRCGHAFEEKSSSPPIWALMVAVVVLVVFVMLVALY